MKTPEVTIITPTFNRAHTLPRVFESLQQQSFQDFEWLVIDDGSTDNTRQLIESYQKIAEFSISYYHQDNQHKFLSLFRGIDLAAGEYICPLDSDDAILPDALETLIKTWRQIPDAENIVFVSAHCQDQNGNLVGDLFPKDPLICTIFDLRYKYNVKGDKWGMGKTETYKKMKLNLEKLAGMGFIPEGVFQFQFDILGYHYCINKVCRTYFRDMEDEHSLANQFYDPKNAFGLAENYKAFLNTYDHKLWSNPKPLIRNLGGYLKFSAIDQRPLKKITEEVKYVPFKIASVLLYPVFKLIS